MNHEPERLILYFLPLALKINLDLHNIEDSIQHEMVNIIKTNLVKSTKFGLTIHLLHNSSNFSLIYHNSYENYTYNNTNILNERPCLNKIEIFKKSTCERCKLEKEVVGLSNYGISVCSNCLFIYIKEIMKTRMAFMISELFYNFECKIFIIKIIYFSFFL
jgi:hypothetical protein